MTAKAPVRRRSGTAAVAVSSAVRSSTRRSRVSTFWRSCAVISLNATAIVVAVWLVVILAWHDAPFALTFDDGTIVRICLDRPEARNAQNRGMLVELNDAFLAALR